MNEMITRHLSIRGRVQGVGFRNYIEYKAQQLGISGWVRNRTDGSVEAVVQGNVPAVDSIIECAQRGPRASKVENMVVDVVESEEHHQVFEIRPTV